MTSPPLNSRRVGVAPLWGPTWRLLLVVVLGFSGFAVVWGTAIEAVEATGGSFDDRAGLVFLDLMAGAVAMALYPLRRRKPLLVVATIVVLSSVSVAAFPAAMFAVMSLATRRRTVDIVVISALLLLSFSVNLLIHPMDAPLRLWEIVAGAALLAIPVLSGMYIGARRLAIRALQERADQLQREQDARLEAARLGERSRIARDMHDSLAHRLSLVALHAGALEYRTDLSPEEARSTAGVVLENARLAASDLREVLGVLRDPENTDFPGLTRPAPSALETINLLVQESENAGNPTTLSVTESTSAHIEELSAPLRQHVNRIIQEGLTNARKHAPGEPITVGLDGNPGHRLAISLSNTLVATNPTTESIPSGFGLMGLDERTRIAGGDLTTDVAEGIFTLRAWFPWTA